MPCMCLLGQERQDRCRSHRRLRSVIDQARIDPDHRLAKLAQRPDLRRANRRGYRSLQGPAFEHVGAIGGIRRMVVADIARLKARREAKLARISLQHCAPMTILPTASISSKRSRHRRAHRNRPHRPHAGRLPAASVASKAAALAGLAPFDDDSGKHRGERHIAGGCLRRSLFAAKALPAAFRWNKALIEALQPPSLSVEKAQQRSSHRLRQKASDLRQHRRSARHAMDRKTRSRLMVATR